MTMDQEISTTEMNDSFDDKHFEFVKGAYMGVGPGWYNLVHTLCHSIDEYLKWRNRDRVMTEKLTLQITQIKEKFGTLRFYTGPTDDRIQGMIDFAEQMSTVMCEQCGKPGQLRKLSWMQTLCDEHYEQAKPNENRI